jgi:hypothetical protein
MGIFLINLMVFLFPECFFYFPSEEFSRILFVYLSDMVIFPDFVWLWLMDWCVVSLLRQYEQSVWMHSCHLGYDWWIGSILDLRGILPWKCLPIVFLVLYVSFESLCLKFKDDIIWDSLFFIMHSIIYIIFIRCEKYVNLWFMKDEKWNTGLQRCFGTLSNLHFRIKKKINVPLFKKLFDKFFFWWDFMRHFEGRFEGAKTFLTSYCPRRREAHLPPPPNHQSSVL